LSGLGTETLRELLEQSLAAWHLAGSVQSAGDGAVLLSCNAVGIRVEPAPQGSPFRWMVTARGRTRGAISLIAVLRQVRATIEPGYERHRVRVMPAPVLPP
jgi:hypothetical protein